MIGYYAHSHGSGHCNYAAIFAEYLGDTLTIFTDSSFPFSQNIRVVSLPSENPDGTEFDREIFKEPSALNYAPINMQRITARNHIVLSSVLAYKIKLLIVDVSVEMAMLCRVSTIPYAFVRLQGNRNDLPHINAFEGATFLLAYFPKELEPKTTAAWIVEKTVYLGFISKYLSDTSVPLQPFSYKESSKPKLLCISGFGGASMINLAGLDTKYDIHTVGPSCNTKASCTNKYLGVVASTKPYIYHADTIIAACGANTTAEILTLDKRFVAIAEERPYEEQQYMASSLHHKKLAISASYYATISEAVGALEVLKNSPVAPLDFSNFYDFLGLLLSQAYRADTTLKLMRNKELFIPIQAPQL